MQVIVYADPENPAPSRLQVMYAGLDTLEESAAKFLDPFNITYQIVDNSVIPDSPYIAAAQTLDLTSGYPSFGWDMDLAKKLATAYNSRYWQTQYEMGLLGTGISNDYQLQLAVATPPEDRTADQVAAVEFMVGINGLQQNIQNQIDAANNGGEIIEILSQLG